MPKVRNLQNVSASLVQKNGESVTVKADGEPVTVDYDPNNEHNRQMFAMGVLELAGSDSAPTRAAKKLAAPKAAKRASRKR